MTEEELEQLRQDARSLKNSSGKKMCHCYEQMAQERGYNTYAALLAHMKKGQVTVE